MNNLGLANKKVQVSAKAVDFIGGLSVWGGFFLS